MVSNPNTSNPDIWSFGEIYVLGGYVNPCCSKGNSRKALALHRSGPVPLPTLFSKAFLLEAAPGGELLVLVWV